MNGFDIDIILMRKDNTYETIDSTIFSNECLKAFALKNTVRATLVK